MNKIPKPTRSILHFTKRLQLTISSEVKKTFMVGIMPISVHSMELDAYN